MSIVKKIYVESEILPIDRAYVLTIWYHEEKELNKTFSETNKYLEIHSKINKYLEIKLKAAGHHQPIERKIGYQDWEYGGYNE